MKPALAPTPPDRRLRRVPWSRACLLPRRPWLLLAACAGSLLLAGSLSGPARAESPESVAKAWAEELRVSLRSSHLRTKTGTGLGLRPLDPQAFAMLNGRQRRQVYEWLLNALGRTMLDSYHLADHASLTALARELEDKGDPNWLDRYLEILRNDSTRISIECTGTPGETTIGLSCSARDIQRDGASLGRATASFRLDWLNRPIALDLAVGSIAGAVVGRMKEPGALGRPRIVDHRTGGESPLATHVAGALEVAIDEQMRTSRAWRPVGAGESESEYRLEGQVRALDEIRLELRVSVHLDDRRLHSVSETISCASIPPSFPCAADPDPPPPPPDPTRIVLPDGFTLADWVLIAEERLEAGEHESLLAEASSHLRNYGLYPEVADVRERAIAGLVAGIRITSSEDAPQGLERIASVEALVGKKRPELSRLKAKAHRLLGNYSEQEAALVEWLNPEVAPPDHPERLDVVLALRKLRRALPDYEKFSELIGRPFSPDIVDEKTGWTDLHFAALLNLPHVAEALLDAGMAPDTRLTDEDVRFGDALMQALVALGKGDIFDRRGWEAYGATPLMISAFANARATAELLLGRGAEISMKNNFGGTPLHWAAFADAREIAELLVGLGADISAKDNHGSTPLHWAAAMDARAIAELLLDRGAETEVKGELVGRTPLHDAAYWDARSMAELLLDRGADISAKDGHGGTPLHTAAQEDARSVAELLLDRGADIAAKDNNGDTPLQEARYFDSHRVKELLLRARTTRPDS